jgi:predicted helicase
VGVVVYFLVKNEKTRGCQIYYHAIADYIKADEKKAYLRDRKFTELDFERITPDKNHNWIHLAEDNDWENLLPVCSKEVKVGKGKEAIFELFSLGVVTNRDEWVYDFDSGNLAKKIVFLTGVYNKDVDKHQGKSQEDIRSKIDYSIKWTRAVKNDLEKGKKYTFDENRIIESLYRPFVKNCLYFSKELNEMQYQNSSIFGESGVQDNTQININVNRKDICFLASKTISDLHFLGDNQCLPLHRYDKQGNRIENITNWGLEQFQTHYRDANIEKLDIFHYVYAVLHNPAYRQKYELNLKREFPRIPFYPNFWQWAAWGKQLMDLHVNYESVTPFQLTIQHNNVKTANPKVKLKADKLTGVIELDEQTRLHGIPTAAWEYKLGNRSALEWILDQYKEKKISDPTIAEKFDNYRFANYKDTVIDLLQRVCTVSVKTVEIVNEMANAEKNCADISDIT